MTGRSALAACALAVAACAGDDADSLLAGPRVIAVIAEPPVIAADGAAALDAVVAIDGAPAAADAIAWRACDPSVLVVDPVRDCAGDAALALAGDGARGLLDAAAVLERFAPGLPPVEVDDPCGRAIAPLDVVAEITLGGTRLVARKQVWIGVAPPPRTNPDFARVVAGGVELVDGATLAAGQPIAISADLALASLDATCSAGADAPDRVEAATIHVVPGAGSIGDRSFGFEVGETGSVAGSVELVTPDEPGPLDLWLVAVDQDGGTAAAYRRVEIGGPGSP